MHTHGYRERQLMGMFGPAPGVEKALAALWGDMRVQRCTVATSTVIFSPMRPTACVRKSPPLTTI